MGIEKKTNIRIQEPEPIRIAMVHVSLVGFDDLEGKKNVPPTLCAQMLFGVFGSTKMVNQTNVRNIGVHHRPLKTWQPEKVAPKEEKVFQHI